MNEDSNNSCLIKNRSKGSANSRTVATATDNDHEITQNELLSTQSPYESFFLFCIKIRRFVSRLGRDLFVSLMRNWFPNQVPFPNHIADLFRAHDCLQDERQTVTVTYSRELRSSSGICMRDVVNAFKSYVLSSEHLRWFQRNSRRHFEDNKTDCEALSVFMNSSYVYNPYSNIMLPENGRDQSRMPTISTEADGHLQEPSEDSLDAILASFPASARSSVEKISQTEEEIQHIVNVVHNDDEFLMAAEVGDVVRLKELIAKGADVHQMDFIERNALHLAVVTGNRHAVLVLLEAGVNPRVKDQIGMSPLSLCLMRRPSWRMATMLFEYGAEILPRTTPMDTGLFLQFVMMCKPTKEEERLLHLLVDKGALVNDPQAPGGRQALHFAAMSNNCRLINILLDMGADLFLTNHRLETPKQVAATFKCRDAFKLLEERENLLNAIDAIDST